MGAFTALCTCASSQRRGKGRRRPARRNLLKMVSAREPVDGPRRAQRVGAGPPGTWLLTGGAGYIGAHVARALRPRATPSSFSTISRRGRWTAWAIFISSGRACSTARKPPPRAVEAPCHGDRPPCGEEVGAESLIKRHHYYEVNVVGTLRLMEAAALGGRDPVDLFVDGGGVMVGLELTHHRGGPHRSGQSLRREQTRRRMDRAADGRGQRDGVDVVYYFNAGGCALGIRGDDTAPNLIPTAKISAGHARQSRPVFGK